MEHIVYNQEGKETGKITLPPAVFGVSFNADLIHQVATSLTSSARSGTAHTKTRGDVSGGGKKPWRQKGTGRARHGSTRSPIWVGGGVAHGPRSDKNYTRKVNRQMKNKAFYSALSTKLRDGEVLFLENLTLSKIKTKDARDVLAHVSKIPGFESVEKKKANSAFFVTAGKSASVEKSFRNIGNVTVGEARNLNLLDVLTYKYIVVTNPPESIKALTRSAK